MIQYTISVALGLTSAAFLVAVYALLPSRPKAYVSLDSSVTVAKYNESGLNALRICTIICALAQTAASVYFLYSVVGLGFAVSLPFALACLGWVIIFANIKGFCCFCLWENQPSPKFSSRWSLFAVSDIDLAWFCKLFELLWSFFIYWSILEQRSDHCLLSNWSDIGLVLSLRIMESSTRS